METTTNSRKAVITEQPKAERLDCVRFIVAFPAPARQGRRPTPVSSFQSQVSEFWFWKGCKPNSVCALRRRESFVLATDTRNLFRFHETRSGQLLGFLFGLAPDGVCRAVSLALHAVRSYRTFSPSPPACADGCLFSVALSVGTS